MKPSPQQDKALKAVDRWARDPHAPQVFRLFGFAGTGKTTLARHFAESFGPGEILFGAYTGKAALVLRQKGCAGATTLHSLMYIPKERGRERVREAMDQLDEALKAAKDPDADALVARLRRKLAEEKRKAAQPAFDLVEESPLRDSQVKVIVVDEASMIDKRMGEDLLSFGAKVLALGDPGQLPPPRGTDSVLTSEHPDILLTEIHRQAKDNPILKLATMARQGRPIPLGTYGDSEVVMRGSVDMVPRVMRADQLLVGRNRTRTRANAQSRRILGRSGKLPETGDKLVCLRNNRESGLLNGSLWEVVTASQDEVDAVERQIELVLSSLDRDDGLPIEITAWDHAFLGEDTSEIGYWTRKEADELDYGYALTVHKSQGSQWDDVVILDESHAFRADAARHLYTAITRAAERVTIVQGY